MNGISHLLLTVKNWQLAIVAYLPPLLIFLAIRKIGFDSPEAFEKLAPYVIALGAFQHFLAIRWYMAFILGLNDQIEPNKRLSMLWAKLFMALTILGYMMGIGVIHYFFIAQKGDSAISSEMIIANVVFGISTISYLVLIFLATRSLLRAEKDTSISGAIIDFVLITNFSIGLWFIQPRLNKLMRRAKAVE